MTDCDWQPIETCPPKCKVLVWIEYDPDEPVKVCSFQWLEKVTEEVESETQNASGRRRVIQERSKRVREWSDGCEDGYEWWQPIPAAPAA